MTLLLTRSDIDGLVPMRAVIDAVELAFADMSRRTASQPAPSTLSLSAIDARFLPMAAMAERQKHAVVKLLADIPGNRAKGLPPQRSVVVLSSIETGECIAMLDGMLVTRQRTAAASAVASRHLARPNSKVLGLVGAGGLAAAHIEAMLEALPIENVLVWSRSSATLAAFVGRAGSRFPHLKIRGAASPRDVVEGSDVVCTLTPGKQPIVFGEWFQPGLHLNAVGAPPRADHREIDAAGMARAKVFVDSMATVMHESGDLLLAIADGAMNDTHVVTELGDVIVGRAGGRTAPDEITLYDSVGIAMEDLVTADLIVRAAQAANVGINFDFAR
jgi:alanine dehydrogenase